MAAHKGSRPPQGRLRHLGMARRSSATTTIALADLRAKGVIASGVIAGRTSSRRYPSSQEFGARALGRRTSTGLPVHTAVHSEGRPDSPARSRCSSEIGETRGGVREKNDKMKSKGGSSGDSKPHLRAGPEAEAYALASGEDAEVLYFSFRRSGASKTTDEVFLGSRTLHMLPLAVSMLASIMSGSGVIGFVAHFYAYGLHNMWTQATLVLILPVIVYVFIPVIYNLRVTSVFQALLLSEVVT
ncbi:hypothetical protein HPB47_025642 [Ixodes persulcatus]|uniref:Uncharacterized protein n=1 Tax=Ixodes persulcatus TaxID=34615 RepID=A0AC60Q3A9_IXOPE|nr:hypothetical protein HPB47_025642 [Ixodes persulcatus]